MDFNEYDAAHENDDFKQIFLFNLLRMAFVQFVLYVLDVSIPKRFRLLNTKCNPNEESNLVQ